MSESTTREQQRVEEEERTESLALLAEKEFVKDKSNTNFDDETKPDPANEGLEDAYLIELLGRLTMIKNELDYNRATNYIWVLMTIMMCAVIQVEYAQIHIYIAMLCVVEIVLLFNIIFIFIPLYGKLFIVQKTNFIVF